jgi:hypothetical protein
VSRFDSLQEDMKGISEAVKNVKSKYGITSLGFESCNGVERFWTSCGGKNDLAGGRQGKHGRDPDGNFEKL